MHRYTLRSVTEYLPRTFCLLVDPIAKRRINLFRQPCEWVVSKLQYQMNMRRHETIGDYPRIVSLSRSSEKLQIPLPSALDIKVKPPVVKSLNDVKQTARDMKSGIAWHSEDIILQEMTRVNLLGC